MTYHTKHHQSPVSSAQLSKLHLAKACRVNTSHCFLNAEPYFSEWAQRQGICMVQGSPENVST